MVPEAARWLQDPALLRLAAVQAARDADLQAARRQVAELEAELGDLQSTLDLSHEQSAALKEVSPDIIGLACLPCATGAQAASCSKAAAT